MMDDKESAIEILIHNREELLKILPSLECNLFLSKLEQDNFLPDNSREQIQTKSTREEKVAYLIDHIIKPRADVHLPILIGVLEQSDDLAVKELACNMKSGTYLCSIAV